MVFVGKKKGEHNSYGYRCPLPWKVQYLHVNGQKKRVMMHIRMLVYRYIHIHRWINTIVSPNIFFPSLLAQIVILAKKMGTTATAGDVSCYVQCNIPTWTVRKDMCIHEKVAIDNLCRKLFYAEKFLLGINPFTKQCPWLTSLSFTCNIGTCNWMTFCISSNNTYNWRNHN